MGKDAVDLNEWSQDAHFNKQVAGSNVGDGEQRTLFKAAPHPHQQPTPSHLTRLSLPVAYSPAFPSPSVAPSPAPSAAGVRPLLEAALESFSGTV